MKDHFKVPINPKIFLAQMNVCVAFSKKAHFFVLVKTAIFYEFSKWRKTEI